jgi:hypothetical protein
MTTQIEGIARRADGTVILSDLYGAAFLAARGNRVLRIEREGRSGRMYFCFEVSAHIDDDYIDFVNDSQIGVQRFTSAVYRLKGLLRGPTT